MAYDEMSVKTQHRSDVRRQAIVDAAVALADHDGIVGVTMRSVAEQLGLGTMTLYSYVAAKGELLDLMLDHVGGEMLLPEPLPEDWRAALRAIALRTRDVLDAHPWIFEAVRHRQRHRVNFLRHVEQSLAAIAPLGLERDEAAAVLTAVDDYTLGYTVRSRKQSRVASRELHEDAATALASGELPLLGKTLVEGLPPVPRSGPFEQGLDWLLDGIDLWLARRAGWRVAD